jgi:hypothetical protein
MVSRAGLDIIIEITKLRWILLKILSKIHPSGLRYHNKRKTIVYAPWRPRGYKFR